MGRFLGAALIGRLGAYGTKSGRLRQLQKHS